MSKLPIYQGGLMRLSIGFYDGPEQEGTTIPCLYEEHDEPVAVLRKEPDGSLAWRWIGPK